VSMTDPIADFITRIRNGIRARKQRVDCPRSNLKVRIAEILRDEGFVDGVIEVDAAAAADIAPGQGVISVTLRYDGRTGSAITGLRRISRPGQRKYVPAKDVPKVRNGLGIAIISTSQGLMSDREARKRGVGGEVLCEVW
jgi:small subunit ribosomal protein S8